MTWNVKEKKREVKFRNYFIYIHLNKFKAITQTRIFFRDYL